MRKKLQTEYDNQTDYESVLKLEIGFMGDEFVVWDLNYNYEELTSRELSKLRDFLNRRIMEVYAQVQKNEIKA